MEELEESDTIELEKVLLNRSWSFWENHESKNKNKNQSSSKVDYSETVKEIYTFDSILLFGNFGINIQAKKADKNKKGKILSLEYIVGEKMNDFFSKADELQIKLIILLIGETLLYGNNINGIRFFDKTKLDYHISVMFIFEIWMNNNMKKEELEEIK